MSISVPSSSFWHHHNHDYFPGDLRLFKLANGTLQGRQVEEDPEDFGTQGRTHRVKKDVIEKGRKSLSAARNGIFFMHTDLLIL